MWCLETLELINREVLKCDGDVVTAYYNLGITSLRKCERLDEMPPVVNEWQTVYCPACKNYCEGKCKGSTCLFADKKVPIKPT